MSTRYQVRDADGRVRASFARMADARLFIQRSGRFWWDIRRIETTEYVARAPGAELADALNGLRFDADPRGRLGLPETTFRRIGGAL